MMGIKVFITDDHYMIVEGIRSLLQHEAGFDWMGHAMNAGSCLAFLQQQQPDVILMDVSLPDQSGIDLCREVKAKYPQIKILGLSSFNQLSFIEKIVENGASGYVLKNATREELIEAIETVAQGQQYFSEEAALAISGKEISTHPVLTRREKEILILIAEGLTNTAIAEKLFISTTTVDTHRKNLLTKFAVKNTALLIRMAVGFELI